MTTGSSMQAITLTAPPHSRHVSMSISSGPAVDPSGLLPLDPTQIAMLAIPLQQPLALQKAGHALSNGIMGKLGEFVACWRLGPAKPHG
jgi:hypothetical protein